MMMVASDHKCAPTFVTNMHRGDRQTSADRPLRPITVPIESLQRLCTVCHVCDADGSCCSANGFCVRGTLALHGVPCETSVRHAQGLAFQAKCLACFHTRAGLRELALSLMRQGEDVSELGRGTPC